MTPTPETIPNATAVHLGALAHLSRYSSEHPALPHPLPAKIWLKELLGLSGMEISLGNLPPGHGVPFQHAHKQNEELYLFLSGEGEVLVDGKVIEVREGSAVRIAPAAYRCWRNTGTEDLVHIIIQAKEGSLEQWTATDGVLSDDGPQWP